MSCEVRFIAYAAGGLMDHGLQNGIGLHVTNARGSDNESMSINYGGGHSYDVSSFRNPVLLKTQITLTSISAMYL
jgi:hypothetical protein